MRIVVPSVEYGDLLALTLPQWRVILPETSSLTVVTSPADTETQAVASRNGFACHVTDAWTRTDPSCHVNGRANRTYSKRWRATIPQGETPTFNLALALDEAFGFPSPTPVGVCAVVDADCYPVGQLPADETIAADTIYGAWRHDCHSFAEFVAFREGDRPLGWFQRITATGRIVQSQHRDVPNVGEGYCQIFRPSPGLRFGSYPGADEYDFDFALKFPKGEMLTTLAFLHLGQRAWNWDGRVTPRWAVAS